MKIEALKGLIGLAAETSTRCITLLSAPPTQESAMARLLVFRIALCFALLTLAASFVSAEQQAAAQPASTWSVSFDSSGLASGGTRRVGYPAENAAASLRHVGKDRRVLEAQAQAAQVTRSADGVVIEMTTGRYSRSMATDSQGHRMSAPRLFGKLFLTLDRNGDIVTLSFRD
jgi:hypothetical protein